MRHETEHRPRPGTRRAPAAADEAAADEAGEADRQRPAGPGLDVGRDARKRIKSTILGMTLEEKVGQLFIAHVYGESADTQDARWASANRETHGIDNACQLIGRYHPGGVIYFTWSGNLEGPEQIACLSNGVQRAAMGQRIPIPVLVATDQEHGILTRVGPPATQFPGSMALGAGRDSADARTAARVTGEELRALGINQNYAPVADVNVNPRNPVIGVRSFGEDPALVADMVAAQVRGFEQANVAATAKHFPGHGDTDVDSHTGLPVIDHTRAAWERIDAPPFRAAVDHGIESIMTAHIVIPSLDPSGDPATLSRPILTGMLRKELGFDGVVVTDALTMAGVRQVYGDERIPALALHAGVDMLLMPPDLGLAYRSVLGAVSRGEISEQRIDESVYRILRMKSRLGLFQDPYVDPDRLGGVVGAPERERKSQEISDGTMTLVKNGGVLPLHAGEGRSVLVTGWGLSTAATLADRIAARAQPVDRYWVGDSPTDEEIEAAVTEAEAHDLTVVTTCRAWTDEQQAELVRRLAGTGKPVIAVAVSDPYDVADYVQVPAFLASYSHAEVSLEAVARTLFGEVQPSGSLPVTIPSAEDPGTVLYPYGHGLGYGGLAVTEHMNPQPRFTRPARTLSYGTAEEAGLVPRHIDEIASELAGYLDRSPPMYAGAVVLAAHEGTIVTHEAVGHALRYASYGDGEATALPHDEWIPMRPETLFDLASLTKVFTAVAVLQQVEAGRVDVGAPVARYIPQFAQNGKENVLVRQLLTHSSGLAAWVPLWSQYDTPAERTAAVFAAELEAPPGERYKYSDLGYIALGALVERVTGRRLDEVIAATVTRPLGMDDTMCNPSAVLRKRIAATEYQPWTGRGIVHGSVHDENAWALGGVAGHAGLFSTAYDLAVFAQTLRNGGRYGGARILAPQTVRTMLTDHNAGFPANAHGYGFELNLRWFMDALSSPATFGHTGYTGTSLVVDPLSESLVVLLTNRVHPTRDWGSNNPSRRAVSRHLSRAVPVRPSRG